MVSLRYDVSISLEECEIILSVLPNKHASGICLAEWISWTETEGLMLVMLDGDGFRRGPLFGTAKRA